MRRHAKASSGASIFWSARRGRRAPLAFLGALVLAIVGCLGAASAIADTAPSVTIGSPSAVAYTTAHVSGTVNPQGGPSATSWHFEYTTDPVTGNWEYAFSASGEISGTDAEGTSPIAVGGELEGLAPGTTYSVRLVAENGGGANTVATAAPYPTLTTKVVAPPSVSINPITTFTATTAQLSGEINPGGTDPAFDTSWHFECTPECPTFLGSSLPADDSSHEVSREATGLLPNTEYDISLIAENGGGQSTAGPVTITTSATPPQATTIPAFALRGGTKALLGARINPTHQITVYWFEYGPDATYGTSIPTGYDGIAGSGSQNTVVAQTIDGLAPQTTYHYRVVAENATGVTPGLDQVFTTVAAPFGPPQESCPNSDLRARQHADVTRDCRAWEMVSPVEKNNLDAGGTQFVISTVQISPSGDDVAYFSNGAFSGAESSQTGNTFIGGRDGDGWSTTAIMPPVNITSPYPSNRASLANYFSADLSKALVLTSAPLTPDTPATPANTSNIYVRDNGTGSYELVTAAEQTNSPTLFGEPPIAVGVSADFRHALFSSPYALTPGADESGTVKNLYEWEAGHPGAVRLVAANAEAGGESNSGLAGSADNAISADGSRVFFNSPPGFGSLYTREGSGPAELITSTGEYWTATEDGSQVLFVDNDGLERYDVGDETTTNVSPDNEPGDGSAPEIEGLVGNSSDLAIVYFIALGQLVPGEGTPGKRNLYVSDNGSVRFIATVGTSNDSSGADLALESSLAASEGGYPNSTSMRAVTADGEQLAFASAARLTAYDNDKHSEVYIYDGRTGQLTCLSCRESGASPQGDALLQPSIGGHLTFVNLVRDQQHNFAAGDSRLYFQTTDALSPDDTNGANDVYQWEDGEVTLVTSGLGNSSQGHLFMGASPSGEDVFFSTRNRVVAQDVDELNDVYDARAEGGLMAQNVSSSATTPCEGEQCRGAASSPPPISSPTSSQVRDSKNVTPSKQKKKKHKKSKHKKHKGKQHKKSKAGKRAQGNG